MTVEAPWGPVAVTTAHLTFVPWRARRQLATVGRFACGGPDGDRAAVLLGDLNLPPRVVEPALRRSGWRTLPAGPTFPSWSPVAQLDHVLVRGALTMTELQVGPAGPSDHLPLTATIAATRTSEP